MELLLSNNPIVHHGWAVSQQVDTSKNTKATLYVVSWLVECCFTPTDTVGLLGTGAQDGHLDFHTPPELWGICCYALHAVMWGLSPVTIRPLHNSIHPSSNGDVLLLLLLLLLQRSPAEHCRSGSLCFCSCALTFFSFFLLLQSVKGMRV